MNGPMLRTADGTPVVLGRRLGRGGEGAVYMVANAHRLALKLYHDDPTGRAERLEALIRMARSNPSPAVAWPRQRVFDLNRATAGFLMEAYPDARPVHELYTPLSRRTFFPSANDAFLARVALNLARVVARLHADGFVIGDLNHSSVLVVPDATVRVVDVDSFPLAPDFICRVGTPEYMPAELQGADLGSVGRKAHHDVFALSVLIFQLLFAGRHPFAGYGGRPSSSLADNIRRTRRFTLSERQRARLGVALPGAQATVVTELFHAVFARALLKRQSARSWVSALTADC